MTANRLVGAMHDIAVVAMVYVVYILFRHGAVLWRHPMWRGEARGLLRQRASRGLAPPRSNHSAISACHMSSTLPPLLFFNSFFLKSPFTSPDSRASA